ncbi:hypothetical protein WJ976_32995 (plasmid) [Achromobacter denitrificans]
MKKFRGPLVRAKRLAGFVATELTTVLAILAILAVYGAGRVKAELDDTIAEFTGTYMLSIKGGSTRS